jgi:hypothetical protein
MAKSVAAIDALEKLNTAHQELRTSWAVEHLDIKWRAPALNGAMELTAQINVMGLD